MSSLRRKRVTGRLHNLSVEFFDGVPSRGEGHKIRIKLLWPGKKEKVWPLNEVSMGDLLTYIIAGGDDVQGNYVATGRRTERTDK